MLIFLVQRIHWLRARAQSHRWKEETVLVTYEMQWTVRYFLKEAAIWNNRSKWNQNSPGAAAYAARQAAISFRRAAAADRMFKKVHPSHVLLVT
jgi:hypothetical protein